MVVGCFADHPINPSYEELAQRGFYIYILPNSETKQLGWLQEVSIWSWGRHCKGIETGETFNPISVSYYDETGQLVFFISIGPWDMAWNHRENLTDAKLDSLWAMDGVATYYKSGDFIRLTFRDRFGIPVQISSRLPITEVIQWINQIEYIGPPPERVTNPWDISKCDNH